MKKTIRVFVVGCTIVLSGVQTGFGSAASDERSFGLDDPFRLAQSPSETEHTGVPPSEEEMARRKKEEDERTMTPADNEQRAKAEGEEALKKLLEERAKATQKLKKLHEERAKARLELELKTK